MIAPQTFNNFPEFGSQATKCKPGDAKYANGFIPGEVFPAEYVNWFFSGATLGVTGAQQGLSSIERELQTLLACAGKNPDVNCFSQVYDSVQYLIQNNLGNAAACPLGTASAGQSTQAARADHVHPKPSYSDLGLGTAALYNCECFRPSTWTPTYVECAGRAVGVIPVEAQMTESSAATELYSILAATGTTNTGYYSRAAIGLADNINQPSSFRDVVIKRGTNDAGTAWENYYFRAGAGGDVITSATIGDQTVCMSCVAATLWNGMNQMNFHYSAFSGQPSYIWGGNNSIDTYL